MPEVRAALANFTQAAVESVARDALDQLTKPMVPEIAAGVPVDEGALKRSIGRRRYTRSHVIFVVLGPRRGYYGPSGSGNNPSRYAHMIEYHPRGTPFLRPVFDRHRPTFEARLAFLITSGLRARGMI